MNAPQWFTVGGLFGVAVVAAVHWCLDRWTDRRRPLVEGLGLPVGRVVLRVCYPRGEPAPIASYRVNEPPYGHGSEWRTPDVVAVPGMRPGELQLEVDRITTGEVEHVMPDGRTVRWRPAGRRWVAG